MATKRPTEEDLGIDMTPEEQEILARPAADAREEDDLPRGGEDEEQSHHLVAPKPEAVPETAEAKAARERDEATGKFLAKPKDAASPPPEQGKVDVRALQEARAENKLLMERMTQLLEAQQRREAKAAQPEVVQPAIPGKDDPMGRIDHIDDRLSRFEAETAAQKQQREQAETEHAAVQQALVVAKPQFDEATASDPTFAPTYNALLESFAKEIAYLNRNDPAFIANPRGFVGKEMSRLENGHMQFAVASGENIADYMRGLAASRGITNQAAPAPAAAQPAPKTIADRRSAQERHMSIGDLPGSASPSTITAKDILKMNPKEFAAYAKRVGDEGLDAVMGKA